MSLLDLPKEYLNPEVFDLNNKMLPEARIFILNDILRILGPGILSGIYMLGSMAGYKYNENSDIDINLVLAPGLDRDDIKEYVKKHSYKKLPGTEHEVGYYVQNYTVPKYYKAKYGVYNLIKDEWASRPPDPDKIRDPEERFKSEIEYSKMYLKRYQMADEKEREEMLKKVIRDRKMAYWTTWGSPRESQQNILYKFLEKALGIRIEKLKP